MVYDCFMYYDEDMLLGLRFKVLADVVDKFVIVESPYTFTGAYKGLNFDINNFDISKDKVIYLVIEEGFLPEDPKGNLKKSQNYLLNGLVSASSNDVVIVSDVDEIPSPSAVCQYNRFYLRANLNQYFFNYHLNRMVVKGDGSPWPWTHPKITTAGHLKSFFKTPFNLRAYQKVRTLRGHVHNFHRKIRTQHINNGGWHFSWVMSPERISKKMSSLSNHQDMNTPEFNNMTHINNVISAGTDIWNRGRETKLIGLGDGILPEYLVEHFDDYKEYFWQG